MLLEYPTGPSRESLLFAIRRVGNETSIFPISLAFAVCRLRAGAAEDIFAASTDALPWAYSRHLPATPSPFGLKRVVYTIFDALVIGRL